MVSHPSFPSSFNPLLLTPTAYKQPQLDLQDHHHLTFPSTSAMGKSRSATIVIAYLMSQYHLTPQAALAQLREGRGVCDPNDGFMNQLGLYYTMSCPVDVESDPAYQRWLYKRELDAARQAGTAPEADKIRFEDEHMSEGTTAEAVEAGKAEGVVKSTAAEFELKCRKCRRTLASSRFLVAHPGTQDPENPASLPLPPSACSHFFLEPLSWMRGQLEKGELEGRLECPNARCRTNVGKWAWQGMRCSCGDWVVPGISLQKGRVDEVKSGLGRKAGDAMGVGMDMGIRRPPGMGGGAGGNNGNL